MRFEKVKRFRDSDLPLPVRKTRHSAGYDFVVAEDIVIPAYDELWKELIDEAYPWEALREECLDVKTLDEVAELTKKTKAKPTLVPTGIKAYLDDGKYLELSVRSSCPLKYWLMLANGVGIIDRDYVDNPDNEGEIFFQIINLSPFPIQLKKGDTIGQGIIKDYYTVENDSAQGARKGGFGSTNG